MTVSAGVFWHGCGTARPRRLAPLAPTKIRMPCSGHGTDWISGAEHHRHRQGSNLLAQRPLATCLAVVITQVLSCLSGAKAQPPCWTRPTEPISTCTSPANRSNGPKSSGSYRSVPGAWIGSIPTAPASWCSLIPKGTCPAGETPLAANRYNTATRCAALRPGRARRDSNRQPLLFSGLRQLSLHAVARLRNEFHRG